MESMGNPRRVHLAGIPRIYRPEILSAAIRQELTTKSPADDRGLNYVFNHQTIVWAKIPSGGQTEATDHLRIGFSDGSSKCVEHARWLQGKRFG